MSDTPTEPSCGHPAFWQGEDGCAACPPALPIGVAQQLNDRLNVHLASLETIGRSLSMLVERFGDLEARVTILERRTRFLVESHGL